MTVFSVLNLPLNVSVYTKLRFFTNETGGFVLVLFPEVGGVVGGQEYCMLSQKYQ